MPDINSIKGKKKGQAREAGRSDKTILKKRIISRIVSNTTPRLSNILSFYLSKAYKVAS